MERRDYAILMGFAALAIVVGAIATSRPLGKYLVAGTVEAANTAVTMAWITWWALVAGFAIAGGVEAWVSSEQISDLLEGAGPRELGYGAFFGFVSSSCSYSAAQRPRTSSSKVRRRQRRSEPTCSSRRTWPSRSGSSSGCC
jgi:hypothetical protein